jgi:hypothetical protein
MRPFVAFVEAHLSDIEEAGPVFQIPQSKWTEIVEQEKMLEKF